MSTSPKRFASAPSRIPTKTAREEMQDILDDQPEDATYDEILRKLAFKRMVDRGLQDADRGKTIGTDELRDQIGTWLK